LKGTVGFVLTFRKGLNPIQTKSISKTEQRSI